MKRTMLLISGIILAFAAFSQTKVKKVYDENIDPAAQVDSAIAKASEEGKFVVCQVGGNWCRWCLMFASFIENDAEIKNLIDDNFVYIHVNYNPHSSSAGDAASETMARLGNPVRFGYPVLVVLDGTGKVVHIQDSSFLESGEGYDRKKTLRFFKNWTPGAVNPK